MKASVVVYLLMGWLSVVMLKELAANVPVGALIWLGIGGILYTVGVVFYSLKKIPYMHVVWHFFVLGGEFLSLHGSIHLPLIGTSGKSFFISNSVVPQHFL